MEIPTSRHDEAVFQQQTVPVWTALKIRNTGLFFFLGATTSIGGYIF